ncbi:Homeobox-DDT domain protein RLT2 [Camellia lanceoleosa]|uniref:Homeobox-DDT domain protein RLT2 n=1 Tax=Camellia lanceoleosa TaxID=1840588 RepID=A0ACC0IMX2_9ERIC|nr:Homeobox-DDT domain protein RLT2 [Camellia lanceoleosa]
MVWRFLIKFADILGLWPFMLDEFVQAFHDYVKPTKARSSIGVTVAYGVTDSLRKANEIISEAAKGKGASIRVPKEH